MKIEPLSLTVRQLCDGYADHAEDGVVAYGGKLDIRPKYQREFIYSEKQQQAVINTAMHGYPLNTMYWAVRGDGTFEVIDGQQRTLSFCRFREGEYDPAALEREVARLMAERVRAITGADIGLGVTGLAGPDGDGVHEVGTVFVSMAVEGETFVRELHLGAFRTRSFIRRMAGNHLYDMMRRWLTGLKL